jgi:hypothetical protein
MKRVLGLLIGLGMFSSVTMAADSSSGCGLGWMVFQKNSLVSSSLRATTNTMFLNTIAMTFGTSGCAKHDIVMNEKKAIHFAEANFEKIMQEMAQGNGEFISSFAQVLGCRDVAGFNQATKNNFAQLVGPQNGVELFERISQEFTQNFSIQKACGTI